MRYVSTRSINKNEITASKAIVNGLAPDGGLYVPDEFPKLESFIGKTYEQLAHEVLRLYLTDFSDDELKEYLHSAYNENLPVRCFGNYLELYHGRTSAFKDVALQLYPYLLTASLRKNNSDKTAVVLVATSGDTGSAVIAGLADVPNTKAIVFYPDGGVSDVQKLQMATQEGENIHVFSIKGNFDDAQTAVKEIFEDKQFSSKFENKCMLTSANSINIGRLLPQIVYYFYSYSELVQSKKIRDGDAVNFVVPTGNFGNILAGYYAHKMGLPINKLICATNSNSVLYDFIKTGVYDKNREFRLTLSPSMDILISSNLERFIYDIGGCNMVNEAYSSLSRTGVFSINTTLPLLDSECVDDYETLQSIFEIFNDNNYILDPHTAVAQRAYDKYKKRTGDETPTVIVSTASPYKFPDAVKDALGFNVLDKPPASISALTTKPILHNKVIAIDDMRAEIDKVLV